jgi:hypothetical protein
MVERSCSRCAEALGSRSCSDLLTMENDSGRRCMKWNVNCQAAYSYAICCGVSRPSVSIDVSDVRGSVKCIDASLTTALRQSSKLPWPTFGMSSTFKKEPSMTKNVWGSQ